MDPNGQWVPHVIAAVDQRITDLRAAGVINAAGLLLATNRTDACAYARIAEDITGRPPVVALSDDPASSDKIAAFRDSDDRIIVAVRQVSEGVDIARLAVCGWLCSYRTPLFFAQAVGRVVRARGPHESATVFLPAVRPLLALAAELEHERNHCITPPAPGDDLELATDWVPSSDRTASTNFVDLLSSEARFAHVLAAGEAVTAAPVGEFVTEAESEELGLFAGGDFLTPEQTATVLAARDHKHREQAGKRRFTPPGESVRADPPLTNDGGKAMWRQTDDLRKQVNGLVARIAARTGRTHPAIHNAARKSVPGPATAEAGYALLVKRRDWLMSHPGG